MAKVRMQYTCDQTGLTYYMDWNMDPEKIGKVNEMKLETPCSICGGKHVLVIVEPRK